VNNHTDSPCSFSDFIHTRFKPRVMKLGARYKF